MSYKILSISDIHIRNNSREEEYKLVFERLYKVIDKVQPKIIVIAGDLFHQKATLSPESVTLANEFLTKLNSKCKVAIISGNHDFPKDISRKDCVKALVELNSENENFNTTYFENEGVYDIGEFVNGKKIKFYAWDFRNKEHTKFDIDKDSISIGIYHGAPRTMFTDEGIALESTIDYSYFDDLDYLITGDIHKREFFNPEKTFFMVGSLICQNFKEENFPHGCIVIDLETKNVKEIDIPNDYGFVTITDDDFEIIDNNNVKFIKKIKYKEFQHRCILKQNYTDEQILSIKKELKKYLKKNISINIYIDPLVSVKEYNSRDVSDINVQNSLITEYCKLNKIAKIEEIIGINKEVNSLLKETSDSLYFKKWIPLYLEFKNIFAFGDGDNIIDFTKIPGITAVSGKNGTGKTSIFEMILFVLFGQCKKITRFEELINDRKDDASIIFKFMVDDTIYRITKEFVRKKSKVTASLTFEIFDKTKNKFVTHDETSETAKDTKVSISKILGNYNDVLISTFAMQNDYEAYIHKGEPERRSYIYDMIGLNIFSQLHKLSSSFETKYKDIIKAYDEVDFDKEIEDLKINISTYKDEIYECEKTKTESNKRLDSIKQLIFTSNAKYEELKSAVAKNDKDLIENDLIYNKNEFNKFKTQINTSKNKITEYSNKLYELKNIDIDNNVQIIKNNIHEFESQLGRLNEKKEEISNSILSTKEKENENNEIKDKINKLQNKISGINEKIDIYYRQSSVLEQQKEILTTAMCKTCLLAKDAFENRDKLIESKSIREKALDYVTALEAKYDPNYSNKIHTLIENNKKVQQMVDEILSKKNLNLENIQKYKDIKVQIERLETDIETHKQTILLFEEKCSNTQNKINELEIKFQESIKFDNEIKQLHDYKLKLDDLETDKSKLEKKLKEMDVSISDLNINIGKFESEINNKLKLKADYENALDKLVLYKTYRSIVNKDGLPFVTLQQLVPVINEKISEYLTPDIANFKLKFEIEEDKLRIMVQKYGKGFRDIRSCGGAETVISSWIIRCVLNEFSILPKSDMLILDEGFGSFDDNNSANINLLFDKFRQKFSKILIISHVPIILEFADNILEVNVDSKGFSSISN